MKYWVYKESRIHGPYDKEAVPGVPGVDAGTLVCGGDPAGGSAWVPAGQVAGLNLPSGVAAFDPLDGLPSSVSLFDQLQIEASGLLDDEELSAGIASDLFQDAAFKKGFDAILAPTSATQEIELRLARDKIGELTSQLSAMYHRISELENAQTDLSHRLATQDIAPAPPVPISEPPRTFSAPVSPPPAPVQPVAQPAPLAEPAARVPTEWGQTPPPAPMFETFTPPPAPAKAEPMLPPMPAFDLKAPPIPGLPARASEKAPEPRGFEKKTFKAVPSVRSFKVLGADEAAPGPSSNPVPEFKIEPIVDVAAPAPAPAAFVAPVVLPPPPALVVPPPATEPETVNPFTLPPRAAQTADMVAPSPFAAPPVSKSLPPVPDPGGELVTSSGVVAPPPATLARSAAVAVAMAAVSSPVDAKPEKRFAKPEPETPTEERQKPPRNNKPFLIGGAVLVTLLSVLGVIFMRQPKEDLKQMTTLDDGKAPIGVPATEEPAIVKPKVAPEPVAPAPPPGPPPEQVAAIAAVKDFPLDGERGTVGRWLQYSYTASPNAGTEEWNASASGDTMLVEYHLVPGSAGGKGALYLFEVDHNGLVMGKNIEARQMLAGGPPPEAPKPKKKTVKKTAKRAPARRVAAPEEPKTVPLLPLPDSGELRPPAEDDGSFGSDTINSGL